MAFYFYTKPSLGAALSVGDINSLLTSKEKKMLEHREATIRVENGKMNGQGRRCSGYVGAS